MLWVTSNAKGQLISKGHFVVFKSTKKNPEILAEISALASKEFRSKNKGTLYNTVAGICRGSSTVAGICRGSRDKVNGI